MRFMIRLGKAIIAIALGRGKSIAKAIVPIIGKPIPVRPCSNEATANTISCKIYNNVSGILLTKLTTTMFSFSFLNYSQAL
jgi:hypothetical protein